MCTISYKEKSLKCIYSNFIHLRLCYQKCFDTLSKQIYIDEYIQIRSVKTQAIKSEEQVCFKNPSKISIHTKEHKGTLSI
jgi:hypothetical protein